MSASQPLAQPEGSYRQLNFFHEWMEKSLDMLSPSSYLPLIEREAMAKLGTK
jgi:hypothetical protein